jgi:hypothetical protein
MTQLALRASLLLLALSLFGCPSTVEVVDSGTDVGGGGTDSGFDAPAEVLDTGVDAPVVMTDSGSDAGMAADGSLLPPYDASNPFGDTGTVGPPVFVPIDVLTDGSLCPAFTPCGGDEVGTWDVTGGCIELDGAMDALSMCPGASLTATGRARGRVTFTGTSARRVAQSEVTAVVFVPTLCATFAGGCGAIQDLIAGQIPDIVCVTASDGCDCEGRLVTTIDDTDAYTISGNQIVGTTKRWDYCVEGDSMRYVDVTPGSAMSREPGIITLGR